MSTILVENDQTQAAEHCSRPLTVGVIHQVPQFDQLETEWESLAEEVHLEHPFLTFAWVKTWWECFGRENSLHIVVVKEGSHIVGIAPLMLTKRRLYGWKLRSLEFISNVHTPRSDFLVAPARATEVYHLIWAYLLEQRDRWDLLLLCQLPEGSRTLSKLSQHALEAGLPTSRWKSADSPFVAIRGTWDKYFKSLKQKHRANLQRRLKRLKELGNIAVECATGKQSLDQLIEEGLRLEGAAWKNAHGTSICSDAAVRKFYTILAERFADRGWLNLHFLTLNGRRIAMQYALSYKHRAFSLKPGYDPAYASYSPSNVLFMLFLERAFCEGYEEYDLLGVNEDWKMNWTQDTRAHYWLFVFSNGIIPKLLYLFKFRFLPLLRMQRQLSSQSDVVPALQRKDFDNPFKSSGVSPCTFQRGRV